MKKAFIFDMDGVLLDSERLVRACILEAAPPDVDRDKLRQAMHEVLGVTNDEVHRIMRERMGAAFSFEDCERRASELYYAHLAAEGVPVKAGARALLSYLKAQGYGVGLATSGVKERAEKELGMAGLWDYFSQRATGDMVARSKPAPDIFLLALTQLGVETSEACVIEDSPNGVRAAAAAGVDVIMVPDVAPATPELAALCCAVLPSLTDVLNWVKSCESRESV